MNCYISAILGFGLLGGLITTNTVSASEHKKLSHLLSPSLAAKYSKIVSERKTLYIQGLVLGLVVALVVKNYIAYDYLKNTVFHKFVLTLGITLLVAVTWYTLVPKSGYMLDSLTTPQQTRAWFAVYKQMKRKYTLGVLLGVVAAILIAKSACS